MSSARLLSRALYRLPTFAVHAAAGISIGLVLVAVGQPIFADDVWWHLAMGELHTDSGPWLEADPFLFSAERPPAPAAWLSGLALYQIHLIAGFQGLRVVHVLGVVAILVLGWSLLRRASASPAFASLATSIFALLSAYRFFQLRPHLVSIGATLLLMRLLVTDRKPPTTARIVAATLLMALWSNSHGGFVLGLVLLAAATFGVAAGAVLWPEQAAESWRRARRLGVALGTALLATLANPLGLDMHRLYFTAGIATPDLAIVADEWAPVALLQLPVAHIPPSPLNWAIIWALVVLTPIAIFVSMRRRVGRPAGEAGERVTLLDPALIALAGASLIGMLSAVRLLWLGFFPLLLLGASLRELAPTPRRDRRSSAWLAAAAALAVLLVPGFVTRGDWPMITRAVSPLRYARPYISTKHHAHAVWFLRDSALEGRLFNDYSNGNFLSYWLAPRLQVFVNGSLNVPIAVLDASRAIVMRSGIPPDHTFLELLDHYEVDVFFGAGTPQLSLPGRHVISTTTHLENEPGWILAFRNMRSAIYLRDVDRNRENLRRVADYYAAAGVPFDPARGFEPLRVVQSSLGWAKDHGLVPVDIERTEAASRSQNSEVRNKARGRLASIYAVSGLYPRAIEIDRRLVRRDPKAIRPARRLVWSLLHQQSFGEAARAAEHLAEIAPEFDGLSQQLIDAARAAASTREHDSTDFVALVPVFTRPEGQRIHVGYREPEDRPDRDPQGPP